MPPSPTDWPLVIYHWEYRWNTSVGKFLARIVFWRVFPVSKTIGVFFLPTDSPTEMGITNDQYSDKRIPSIRPSAKTLPTNCVSYTDGSNLSVKLFNGVVINVEEKEYRVKYFMENNT
jgi:hypothetical protein